MFGGGINATASSSKTREASRSPISEPRSLVGERVTSPAGSGRTTKSAVQRKVRTVPPSAIYDPPTPPSDHEGIAVTLPGLDAASADDAVSPTRKKRPRPTLRYSTDESSADSDDASDDEPPWWTFTQRGMMKMRARSMQPTESEAGPSDTPRTDSGRERKRDRLRSSSKGEGMDTPTRASDPETPGKLRHPMPTRQATQSSLLARRAKGRDVPIIALERPIGVRSNSAPTTPALETLNTGLATPALHPDTARLSGETAPPTPLGLSSPSGPARHSNAFRFLRRDIDSYTDSEAATPSANPQQKTRLRAQSHLAPPDSGGESTPDAIDTPSRPRQRRRGSHRLRLNLPDPVREHFRDGAWLHAGSWQDALHGTYEEPTDTASRKASVDVGPKQADVRNGSRETDSGASLPGSRSRDTPRRGMTPESSFPTAPANEMELAETRRSRSRRTRRYRQALVPPTPSGLGFTPSGVVRGENWKEGKVHQHGFDWGQNGHHDIEEGEELSRSETRVTEKGLAIVKKPQRWFGRSQRPKIETDWRTHWRRVLFLDARVTIWIRLLNLAVVVASLALAVTVRLQLDRLQLPGLIGSSTILIIAYSSFTILHVLTAIYREYFGKPIGLWGLRSKMLWVCLDLLFVALWSSASSLALNDYIGTSLECSPGRPWWHRSSSYDYALPDSVIQSHLAHEICDRQAGCIALSLLALLLYGGNMVLSLFRIFETVRRTANVDRAVMI
ncbi:hypothetical protein BCR39DRAFT_496088 [Naematelia encephala]|uniref:Uncharacterized protein n=1 Tax=Naematelia encephala TaxID=71784 RepID=A0A1Y2B1C5_9TREE|nr:hypothetical protein BCR39DRAFT_496088 [Naematelia encephala]